MQAAPKKIFDFLILAVIGWALFSSVSFYHGWKYRQAVQSDLQVRHCGEFINRTEIAHSQFGRSDAIEPIYSFKNTQGESFSFSGSRHIAAELPELALLQPHQPVCFQYSPQFKDRNGFFLLTKLQR